jgi:hypothetical protein
VGFGNTGERLHKVYGHVIPVGRILSLGGSFESMTEQQNYQFISWVSNS